MGDCYFLLLNHQGFDQTMATALNVSQIESKNHSKGDFMSYFKTISIVLVVMMLLPGLVISAQADSSQSKVKKGAEVTLATGTLVEWKNLKKISFMPNQRRRLKPVMNFKNPLKIVKAADKNDPVVQNSHPLNRDAKTLSNPIITFAGMNQSSNGAGWPPDTNGDVGLTYYIQTVNTSIGIYRKSTGALISATTFDAFFPSAVGSPCDNDNNGDPIVLFDQYNQRWFILDFAWSGTSNGSSYSIAASKTSDPTGAWWTYCYKADNTLMNDYPKCGVWHDGIYTTANMFIFNGNYQHTKIWAFKTPDLYTGTLTAQSTTDSGTYAFSIMPANAKGSTAPSSTAPNYMYAIDASEYGSPHTDALRVWKYNVDWANSSNTTWTGPSVMNTAAYGLVATGVPQSGTSIALDSLYGRLMYSAVYRKFATYESVYLSHVAEYSSRRAMRWYEIRIASGNSSIYQQGTYSPDATHRWMGSVCADKNGSIGLAYSSSSSSMYPAIRYAGRLTTDTLGTMGQGEKTLYAGTGSQTSYTRWGDYSMLSIDPVDDETFWFTTEYLASTGTNWQTRIGSFKIIPGSTGGGSTLGEAVDLDTQIFTTSGTGTWAYQTTEYYNDNDAAASPTITHSQSSSMETTITGKTSVKFYWKVSSEANYDYLRFYIDGSLQDQIAGTVGWTQKSYNVTTGSHTLKWTYYKDGSVSSGSDKGWVDKLELGTGTVTDPIGTALDKPTQIFTLTGNYDFAVTTSDYYYGTSSVVAPSALGDNQSSTMETTISGVTSVKFWWHVSSETNYDYLQFYIDGVKQDQISGTTSWAQKSYTVTSGSHTLKWVYDKDYSVSSGSDIGWVDRLELQ
jgi:hypothetical protein